MSWAERVESKLREIWEQDKDLVREVGDHRGPLLQVAFDASMKFLSFPLLSEIRAPNRAGPTAGGGVSFRWWLPNDLIVDIELDEYDGEPTLCETRNYSIESFKEGPISELIPILRARLEEEEGSA